MKKIIISLCLVLSGCASMFNGSTQPFSVSTANDKLQDETNCSVVNEEGQWQLPPNQTTTINRDGNNTNKGSGLVLCVLLKERPALFKT